MKRLLAFCLPGNHVVVYSVPIYQLFTDPWYRRSRRRRAVSAGQNKEKTSTKDLLTEACLAIGLL